jgi:hypothetical protein
MSEDSTQAIMQSIKTNMIAVGELVKQPEHTMHFDPFGKCEFAQASIPGEQGPLSGFSNCEGEGIRSREIRPLPPNGCCPDKLSWRQDLDAKAQRHELLAERVCEFPSVKQVGNREFKG